ncbi:MAG: SDR family oxidoreductase [Euryarchaeota archaeon]|nr:SDR family oxidoreductase [Euryarchaeota archaeon]
MAGPVLVAGGTSPVGHHAAEMLLRRGVPVRALVRPSSRHGALKEMGAELAFGDLLDPASLGRACRGTGAVVTAAGRHFSRGGDTLLRADEEGNRNLVEAAREAGVGHYVFVSVLWADRDLPPVLFAAKRRAEEHLRSSGLPHTILRPSIFMESLLEFLQGEHSTQRGVPVLPTRDTRPLSAIACRDIARVAVEALRRPEARNATFELGGPEDLTFNQALRTLERVRGRRRVIRVPPGLIGASKPILRLVNPSLWELVLFMEVYLREGFACSPAESRRTREAFPGPLMGWEEFLRASVQA